jgi:hypothetical protein
MIRGVPHNQNVLRDIEKSVGGKVVTDEYVIARLDAIRVDHKTKNGSDPMFIEDSQTHDRFLVVMCRIPTEGGGLPIETSLFFMLPMTTMVNV